MHPARGSIQELYAISLRSPNETIGFCFLAKKFFPKFSPRSFESRDLIEICVYTTYSHFFIKITYRLCKSCVYQELYM